MGTKCCQEQKRNNDEINVDKAETRENKLIEDHTHLKEKNLMILHDCNLEKDFTISSNNFELKNINSSMKSQILLKNDGFYLKNDPNPNLVMFSSSSSNKILMEMMINYLIGYKLILMFDPEDGNLMFYSCVSPTKKSHAKFDLDVETVVDEKMYLSIIDMKSVKVVVFGSGEDSDIRIPDLNKNHCKLGVDSKDNYYLEPIDKNSDIRKEFEKNDENCEDKDMKLNEGMVFGVYDIGLKEGKAGFEAIFRVDKIEIK